MNSTLAGSRVSPYHPTMSNEKATTWITVRVSPQQKARLLNMAVKAGDPNPSITIIRKVFGPKEAEQRKRHPLRSAATKRQLSIFPTAREIPTRRLRPIIGKGPGADLARSQRGGRMAKSA